ncbi:MAG: hypothetical protein HZB47_07095 [Nitrosomonadales bacterium]|nr:hypothetical protein [Nitrosomonadales bacterium]
MSQSKNEMSGLLAELASEATQKLEAQRAQQQDRHTMTQNVNAALERTFQFFNLFTKHLNALEPDIPRIYALDGKAQFSPLKWKSGLVEYRKQSLADNALMDHVFFQVRLTVPGPVSVNRRWEVFDEFKKDVQSFGLKTKEDLHELWRNRTQKATFQVTLEPEFLICMRFQGNYAEGCVDLVCNNLDGFGEMKAKLNPKLLQGGMFDDIGRFLMGRASTLPQGLDLTRDFSRNI